MDPSAFAIFKGADACRRHQKAIKSQAFRAPQRSEVDTPQWSTQAVHPGGLKDAAPALTDAPLQVSQMHEPSYSLLERAREQVEASVAMLLAGQVPLINTVAQQPFYL